MIRSCLFLEEGGALDVRVVSLDGVRRVPLVVGGLARAQPQAEVSGKGVQGDVPLACGRGHPEGEGFCLLALDRLRLGRPRVREEGGQSEGGEGEEDGQDAGHHQRGGAHPGGLQEGSRMEQQERCRAQQPPGQDQDDGDREVGLHRGAGQRRHSVRGPREKWIKRRTDQL